MKNVDIYTDGACSGNPGPGGWSAILIYGTHEKLISGAERDTTNNRMEVLAAISGLDALKTPCNVCVYSDSAYLVNAIEKKWLDKWKQNGWMATGKPVKNRDLWEKLDILMSKHNVKFIKVAGHSDNVKNNRCDAAARAAIKNLSK